MTVDPWAKPTSPADSSATAGRTPKIRQPPAVP